ncbi:hypothetical protein ACIPPQ_21380 [Sphingopyxis sp. LARHCG72]
MECSELLERCPNSSPTLASAFPVIAPDVSAPADGPTETAPNVAVVVAGSRIAQPNIDNSVPITTVSAEKLASRANISPDDALGDLSLLRSTYDQASSTRFIGTAGLNLLDHRDLGTERPPSVVDMSLRRRAASASTSI